MPFPLASLAGGASVQLQDVGGNLLSAWGQNWMNQNAVRAQNDFNSPKNQMLRFKEAGLNPALIYSQGSPGNQPSPVAQEFPKIGAHVSYTVGKALALEEAKRNVQLQDKAILQADADRTLTYDRSATERLRALNEQFEFLKRQANEPYFTDLAKINSQAAAAKLQNLIQDITVKEAQRLNLEMDRQLKNDVHLEKSYYNYLRNFGIEKGDSVFIRSGLGLGRTLEDVFGGDRRTGRINQRIFRK